MFDVVIIGGGPAGLSAAVNILARNKTAVVLGRNRSTSWLYKAEQVNNHLGQPFMSGSEMLDSYYRHAESLSVQIREGRVFQALSMGDYITVNFENEFLEARAMILATGILKGVGVPGEKEFLGRGVSYCATCDGMLYRGKDVAIVAETREGEEDARFLNEICNKVYYIPSYEYRGGLDSKIEVIPGKASEVAGQEKVTTLIVEQRKLPCQGVFFVKASLPPESLVPGLVMQDNAIEVNRNMETNLPGIFAAGDCTGAPYQVSKAIGEGLIAGQQAVKYIMK